MITTIIPCWITNEETLNLTQLTIESLPKSHLIIVDNASTYASGYLKGVADTYIREDKNFGYAKAVNDGLKIAKTPYICISNNDVRVPKDIFKVALEIFEDPKVGSVHFHEIFYNTPFYNGDKVWKTGKERWCTSSFFLIRKEAMILYDEKFDGRGTYDDWSYWYEFRLSRRKLWQTAYTNKSQYQHWGSHSFKIRGDDQRKKYDHINREYFKKKHGDYPEDIWNKLYPKQMAQDYGKGFNE